MWQYNYSDELYHYGVPGMRWGRRKGGIIGKKKKTPGYSVDGDGLTNKSKKYGTIVNSNQISRGKSAAKGILKTLGVATIATAASIAVTYGAIYKIGSEFVDTFTR